ncbi:MAG: DUF2203 domain-containing protein [Acidobacteriaceae bacterium]|nr:DUF2203 domain-containing protein [Acidobacteriaceae bacterium]
MPRFFTLLDAEAALPEVERLLRSIIGLKQQFAAAAAELNAILQRITLQGGITAPLARVTEIRTRKDSAGGSLKSTVERLEQMGVLLKDVDTGLVDFPTIYRDKEVYLCWKLGESGIGFWHHVEDGFRGRQAIDAEFLSNHRAE